MSRYFNENGEPEGWKILGHSLVAFLVLTIILGTFGTVDAGQRGVKVRLGRVMGIVQPGLYFKLPLIEDVKKMNVQTRNVTYEREDPLYSASSDLQDVKIATVVNYHLDPTKVDTIYQQYGTTGEYEERVIRPAVRDTVKAVASQFSAEELVSKRPEFTDKVTLTINERLQDKYVTVERVNITNFEFSESFTQAIEAKVTAVQNAEAAKNKLEQVKFEAQQQIETARATAESQRIQSQALAAQGGADYVQLKAIEKWDGRLPTQLVPGSSVPFLNLNN